MSKLTLILILKKKTIDRIFFLTKSSARIDIRAGFEEDEAISGIPDKE
jgi:hypothetical protein